MTLPDLSYRETAEADVPFLRSLRERTMREIAERHRPWDPAEQEQRLRGALDKGLVIRAGAKDVGLLKVVRRHNAVEVAQLQVLPEWQGRGIGSRIIQDLQLECAAAGVPLVLHIHASSRAIAFFERHGFKSEACMTHFIGMRWSGAEC